jgi:integrase
LDILEICGTSDKKGQLTVRKNNNFSLDKNVNKKQLDKHIKLLKISGLSEKWLSDIRRIIADYLDYLEWTTDKNKTLDYFAHLQKKLAVGNYRKHVFQVRKFLEYLGVEWSKQIKPPGEQEYTAKCVTTKDIQSTIKYFDGQEYYKQFKAVVIIGCTSGLRAEELYQLTIDDINLGKKTVRINHDPHNGQSTKMGKSRVSFFADETKETLTDYFLFFMLLYSVYRRFYFLLFCINHI